MSTDPSFVIELPVGSLAIHDLTVGLTTHRVDANHYDVILAGEGLTAVADAVGCGLTGPVASQTSAATAAGRVAAPAWDGARSGRE